MSRTAIIVLFVFVAYLAISGADSQNKDSVHKHTNPMWPNGPNKPNDANGPDSHKGHKEPKSHHESKESNSYNGPNGPNKPYSRSGPDTPYKPSDPNEPNRPNSRSGPDTPYKPSDPNEPNRPNGPHRPNTPNRPNRPHRSNTPISGFNRVLNSIRDSDMNCGPHEIFSYCGPPRRCQSNCKEPHPICPEVCVPGCVCDRGYVRDSENHCVPVRDCKN